MAHATTTFDATLALQQLTGSKAVGRTLALMIRAHGLVKSDADSYVMFSFKGCRKANKCRITLEPSNTYKVEFFKYNRKTFECPLVYDIDGIYDDMLKGVFEDYTGLYLSLH